MTTADFEINENKRLNFFRSFFLSFFSFGFCCILIQLLFIKKKKKREREREKPN
jgi:hypothetical protein